jgi:glycogen synthase
MAAGRAWDAAKNLAGLDDIAADLAWPVEIAGDATHPEGGVASFRHARLLGILNPHEMARRLGATAIFAALARYEPFGLGVLEAASAGCALVLGDFASLRENWDGAAVFVVPDDRAGWRAALARLIAGHRERARLAGLAHSRARRFAIDRTARAYAALYRALAQQPAAREVA